MATNNAKVKKDYLINWEDRHEFKKQYANATTLFRGQHYGSAEPQNVAYDKIMGAYAEYKNSEKWN